MKTILILIIILLLLFLTFCSYFYNKDNKTHLIQHDLSKDHPEWTDKNTLITFVIPSIGRETLKRTIKSLQNINNKNWNAIIVFDNIEPNIDKNIDSRIKVIKSNKKLGERLNSTGRVRNKAFEYVKTQWVGFVDDDDTLNPTYIDNFLYHLKHNPNLDVIIFRMIYQDGKILPPIDEDEFFVNKVGISFCMRTVDANKYKFEPSSTEDFKLLNKLRNDKKNIIISKHVNYNVGF